MSTGSEKIKFALIGYGHIGKRHARMIQENPDTELIAVCDIQSQETGGIPFYTSAEIMLTETGNDADVVCICTPNGLHARQTLLCLGQGKHVVCEKPMALSTEDCDQMIAASNAAGKKIFCVMQNRYSPAAAWLKGIVTEGLLGEIILVRTDCFWNRDSRYYTPGNWRGTQDMDGGTLFTQFSHFVDLLIWIFGNPAQMQGLFGNFTHQGIIPFEDTGTVQFTWENGGLGVLNYSTSVWDQNLESSITIIGSKGSVQIAGQYMNEVKYCHIDGYDMPVLPEGAPPNEYGTYKGSAANHHFVIQNVADTLKGRAEMSIQPEEGRAVVEVIERMYGLKLNKTQG